MISVHSDVGGKTITLNSNGKEITWSRADAQQAADMITLALIRLRQDDIAKQQQNRVEATYANR